MTSTYTIHRTPCVVQCAGDCDDLIKTTQFVSISAHEEGDSPRVLLRYRLHPTGIPHHARLVSDAGHVGDNFEVVNAIITLLKHGELPEMEAGHLLEDLKAEWSCARADWDELYNFSVEALEQVREASRAAPSGGFQPKDRGLRVFRKYDPHGPVAGHLTGVEIFVTGYDRPICTMSALGKVTLECEDYGACARAVQEAHALKSIADIEAKFMLETIVHHAVRARNKFLPEHSQEYPPETQQFLRDNLQRQLEEAEAIYKALFPK